MSKPNISTACAATRLRIRHSGIGHAIAMPRAICIFRTMHWTSLSITQRGACVLLDLHPQPISLQTDSLKSHRRQRRIPTYIRPPAELNPKGTARIVS